MSPFDLETPLAGLRVAGPQTPPSLVTIRFKACSDETGGPKTWLFTRRDHVAIVQGRVHLCRTDKGLVCNVPVEEVAYLSAADDARAGYGAQETSQAGHEVEPGHATTA